ncbi:MAG: PAS domain S-box protein [Thermodesulfobacteriota bacterium]|nr:PAS domain S-box protein [Thermodesulfobacteriota bacterium]
MKDLILQKTFFHFCESLSFPIVIFKPDMTVISANTMFYEKYGMTEKDVLYRKCYEIFFSSDKKHSELEHHIDILMTEKKEVSTIRKRKLPDGTYFYEDLILSPLLNDEGDIDCIVATFKDITRSKHMEADLKKTKEFLEKIIESSVNAIVVADMKGVLILMNESARKIFGYSDQIAVGKSIAQYHYTPGGARSIMKKLRSTDYGGVGRLNSTKSSIINSSNEEISVELTASIIYENGKEIASMAIFQDLRPKIEAEKNLEKARMQLVQSDKLASVGRLAAGVAHEINNPLGGITMYSHLALEDLSEDASAFVNLQKIISQTERCKKIVKGLLDFSRQHEPEIKSIDVNDIIDEILSLVETQSLFQNIEVNKLLDENIPSIMGDQSQLQQVFMNLALNAAEAMEDGGKLTVESSFIGDNSVEIKFTDTGYGISPEDMGKIFEPFFTTKSEKSGTGLGLAVSHGIITKHQGTISVESNGKDGTTFKIKLPAKVQ